jgi:uncharacterized protein (DUF885 family)
MLRSANPRPRIGGRELHIPVFARILIESDRAHLFPAPTMHRSILPAPDRSFDEIRDRPGISPTWLIRLAIVSSLVLLPGCDSAQGSPTAFFDDFTDEWVRGNPNQAIATGYFTGPEQERLERQLTPLSREWQLDRVQLARTGLEGLEAIDRSRLSEIERVSADVMKWQLEQIVEGAEFLDLRYPLQQMGGANVSLVNTLTVNHPLANRDNAESYLARLSEVDERMREAVAEARRQSGLGYRPPAFILRTTIQQMERFLSAPADNPLVVTYRDKLGEIAELTDDERAAYVARAEDIVADEVYPAWREGIAELRAQLPLATEDAGLWRFENGAEAYAYDLRRFTTTNLTAEEIHEIGLREVARIEAQMDSLFRIIGLGEGSIQQRVEQLQDRLAYELTPEGRARIMADIDQMMADAQLRSAELFDLMPRAPVLAQPYPEFRWETAAASYTAPPLDGSRPGIFQMPLRANRMTSFGLRTLVYHETVPGHHYQIALTGENPQLPRFMQVRAFGGISAPSEGWALYAERLAGEEGWYEGDIEGLLGQLDGALFRARRLVVDTGIHAKGWTRQQAIDYGIAASEVDRYVVNPGQACSYMIGQLTIIELREKARAALGEAFSLRDFHNVVLSVGIVPLTILEAEVDRYIAGTS